MVAAFSPAQDTTTTLAPPAPFGECFDCGDIAPVEPWTDDAGAVSMLCIEREACRRRQLGNCEECITLDRRCWSCRHPQVVSLFRDTPADEYGESCPRCEGSGCDTCQPIARRHDRPYDFD